MKKIRFATACVFSAAILATAGQAYAQNAPTCIQSELIDHTSVVDAKTVLFHMRGGTIWQNNLPTRCSGLKLHGFVVRGHDSQICGGSGITLIESGSVCMLGKFAAYTAPAK